MDKVVKIETVSKQTFRSKSTNKTYDTKEEFLRNHKEEDLAVDTAKGRSIKQWGGGEEICWGELEANGNYGRGEWVR